MSLDNKIKRIFLTHCSAKKDDSLKENDLKITPDKLYTATATQRFINRCKNAKAIVKELRKEPLKSTNNVIHDDEADSGDNHVKPHCNLKAR